MLGLFRREGEFYRWAASFGFSKQAHERIKQCDLQGFPPTILTSGTRDLFLSNTVRVHRKLRAAGVVADLIVFEGQSHAQYLFVPDASEAKEYFIEVTAFLDRQLEK
jgi:epsilon-lactone hydrolase